MTILGIETSCDETACAVVKDGKEVLSETIASSAKLHIKTGGVVPENAARKQVEFMLPVLEDSLKQAFPGMETGEVISQKIDAIAVTYGPGLIGSLLVGVESARVLSYYYNKPLIPANHLIAHIYANFISVTKNEKSKTKSSPEFPAIALVVSGGHTDFVLMKNHTNIKWIGGTRDDAAGECFDKCARLLGLSYPGGPNLSKHAEMFLQNNPGVELSKFPRPMMNSDNLDMSFSGLKTSVFNYLQKNKPSVDEISAEIQEAIVDLLVEKSIWAIKRFQPKSFLLSGGVAANQRLRERLIMKFGESKLEIDLYIPPSNLCTDNAVIVAGCAYYNYKPVVWNKVHANPQLEIAE